MQACIVISAVRYMQLLINEDDRRNLAATISRRLFDTPTIGVRNYRTPASIGNRTMTIKVYLSSLKTSKSDENS